MFGQGQIRLGWVRVRFRLGWGRLGLSQARFRLGQVRYHLGYVRLGQGRQGQVRLGTTWIALVQLGLYIDAHKMLICLCLFSIFASFYTSHNFLYHFWDFQDLLIFSHTHVVNIELNNGRGNFLWIFRILLAHFGFFETIQFLSSHLFSQY